MITEVCIPVNIKGLVPVGSPIPWLKSYANTPALPSEYAECNGQVLSDAESVYNGQTLPDLNGVQVGSIKRFLRGSSTSGSIGGTEQHAHQFLASSVNLTPGSVPYYMPRTDITYYVSTLPSYYEVVYVVRVK